MQLYLSTYIQHNRKFCAQQEIHGKRPTTHQCERDSPPIFQRRKFSLPFHNSGVLAWFGVGFFLDFLVIILVHEKSLTKISVSNLISLVDVPWIVFKSRPIISCVTIPLVIHWISQIIQVSHDWLVKFHFTKAFLTNSLQEFTNIIQHTLLE